MKIQVYLDEKVFRNFTLFDFLQRRKFWKYPVIFALIMCSSAIISYVMNHVEGAIFLGTVLLVIGLGIPVAYFYTFFSSVKKQVAAQNLNPPRLVYTLDLTEKKDGIFIADDKNQVNYKWKDVYKVYKNKDCTYLFMNKERAFLIPHSCVSNEVDTLWTLLQKQIDPKKRIIL